MAISVDQYTASGSTSVSSLVSNYGTKTKEKTGYSEDVVTISQEALELVEELRNKKSKSFITTDMEAAFARVANALPNSEDFTDMLNLLTGWARGSGSVSSAKVDDPDRNAYAKDPHKYAEMWKELHENYSDLMKSLKLDPKSSNDRKLLADPSISPQVRSRFMTGLTDDTKKLLKFFNIDVG